jgi:hypothetical protein
MGSGGTIIHRNNQTRQTCEEDEYPVIPRHSELRTVEAESEGPGEWTSEGGLNREISQ